MDAGDIARAVTRIAHEILERNKGIKDLALVGIRTGGVHLAHRLVRRIHDIEGTQIPIGELDITLYRDDLSLRKDQPILRKTSVPFKISDLKVVLVDDVLFTGRTIRAGLDAMLAFGRPASVQLLVLIDRRFNRELPIQPDYVGRWVDSIGDQRVSVEWAELDGKDRVLLHGGAQGQDASDLAQGTSADR